MNNKKILELFTDRLSEIYDNDDNLRDSMLQEATDCLDSYDPDDVDFLGENAFEYFYERVFENIPDNKLEEFVLLDAENLKQTIYKIV